MFLQPRTPQSRRPLLHNVLSAGGAGNRAARGRAVLRAKEKAVKGRVADPEIADREPLDDPPPDRDP